VPCLATAAEHPGRVAFTRVAIAWSLFVLFAASVAARAAVAATGR
jgi:hypothetical protein